MKCTAQYAQTEICVNPLKFKLLISVSAQYINPLHAGLFLGVFLSFEAGIVDQYNFQLQMKEKQTFQKCCMSST